MPTQRIGAWVLAALVLGSGLALGAIHTPVLVVCALAATLAAAWSARSFLGASLGAEARILLYVVIGLTAWTALQLVPLPKGLVEAVAGETADVWSRCLRPLRESGPATVPLSLDPPATLVQVLRGLTYLATLIAALEVAQRREGRTFLQRVIIVSATTMAAAAVAHPALDVHRVFLVYEPKDGFSYEHIAPLLNVNHLSAYMNIGALVALASLFERPEESALPRPVAVVIVLLLSATTVWSGSRGGFATLAGGSLLVVVLSLRRFSVGKASIATGLGGVVVAAALLLSSFDTTRSKLIHNDLSKLDVAKAGFQMLRDFLVFGIGRGSFESVFQKVRTGTENLVFTHPENVVVQWTTEWGLFVGAAAILAIVWALRPRRVFARVRPPLGAWVAIIAVGAQNFVDFSSEIPGVVIALTVCAAIVTGGSTVKSDPTPSFGLPMRRRVLIGGGAALLAIVAILCLVRSPYELRNDEHAFMELGLETDLDRAAFNDAARAVMLRHPAEPYFPFVGAVRATSHRGESVMPWAEQALERNPAYGRVHLLIARSLQAKNRSQARLEYRVGCSEDGVACALPETLPLVDRYEDALELVPDGPHGAGEVGFLIQEIEPRLPCSAVRLGRELTARSPTSATPLQIEAHAALSDVTNNESWCADELRNGCIEDGTRAATAYIAAVPDECEGYAVRAELQREGGNSQAAFDGLDNAINTVQDRAPCAIHLLELAKRTHDDALVSRAIARLENVACASTEECTSVLVAASQAEGERHHDRRALAFMKKAWERSGNDSLLANVAQMSAAQGVHGEALDAYSKLAARHPEDPKWPALVERERAAVAARPWFDPMTLPSSQPAP